MPKYLSLLAALLLIDARGAAAQPATRPNDLARAVTLPLAEFDRLSELASRARTPPPPVPSVLSSAELRIRVDGTTARGDFLLAGSVLSAGEHRVALVTN